MNFKEYKHLVNIGIGAKTLVPSYYSLYSLYNKIRNKGKIVSAGY
jgi:hypothetical protein